MSSFEALLFILVKNLEFEFLWTSVVLFIIRNSYMHQFDAEARILIYPLFKKKKQSKKIKNQIKLSFKGNQNTKSNIKSKIIY
jgi:hypothetical protein